MATAPVDIPIQVKGLSDLQKLERRMAALEREVTRLQGKLPKTNKELDQTGRSARRAAAGIKAVGTAIKTTLGPLIAATAAIGGLVSGFKTIAGQDFAEAKVRSLGVNSEELVANLKEVSKELQGNASVAELTAAAYDVASAGFTDAADAAMVLKAASLGAVGGFSDINTVGDAATSVLNAYGKSAKEAGLLVDGFIQTQNDGKIVVDEYARNIGKVASAAAGLKIPIEEVNAVIAQSTAAGNQAEVAFTGLKGALARLASGEATKALKGVGLEINAATLEADGLLGTFKKIKAAGLDTGQLFKAFGTEAGPALLPVLQNLEKFEELLKNQENAAGAAQRAQQQAANTINGAWNRVRVAFENLFSDQAELAKAIIPILDAVATAINGATKALKNFSIIAGEVQGTIDAIGRKLPLVAQAFGKLGEAIAFAANALGKLLLRADGFDAANASGFGRGGRNFGANYKEQEAALFKAAEAFRTAQKEAQLTTTQTTPIPGFDPKLSGGGEDQAAKAAAQLKAAQDLLFVEQNRRMLLGEMTELERINAEGKVRELEIERQFAELLANAVSKEEEKVLLDAQALALSNNQLEADLKRAELQKQAVSGIEDEIGLLRARLSGTEEIYQREKDIQALMKNGSVNRKQASGLVDTRNQLKNQLKELNKIKAKYDQIAKSFANALASGLKNVLVTAIEGGDIQQAFSDLFAGLADVFLNIAFEQVAEMLAETISDSLSSGIDTAAQQAVAAQQQAAAGVMQAAAVEQIAAGGEMVAAATEMMAAALIMAASGVPGKASGGPVVGGNPYVVGENGPELFVPSEGGTIVPNDYMASAMEKYSPGMEGGGAVDAADGGGGGSAMGSDQAPTINIEGGVMQFDNGAYIRQDQIPSIVSQASKQGEARALRRLQMSPSARRKAGI